MVMSKHQTTEDKNIFRPDLIGTSWTSMPAAASTNSRHMFRMFIHDKMSITATKIFFSANRILFSFLLVTGLLLTGCCTSHEDWREYRIFCGMSRSDGTVSEAEWEQFCDKYVTAEFPDGYTTMNATGYWMSDDVHATMREDARIIIILAPSDAKEKVRRIAGQYRLLFRQEAVLIVTSPADAVFVGASSEKEP